MYSAYHFFLHLVEIREGFLTTEQLSDLPFDQTMLACRNKDVFPDLVICLNAQNGVFSGGEMVELKDSKSYNISSFNSTIPTGQKKIDQILSSDTYQKMVEAGDDVHSVPIRDVYYLIRGRKQGNIKVCLVHGSFFETIRVEELIQGAFAQVFEERAQASDFEMPDKMRTLLLDIFSDQSSFSKVRDVEAAAVKIRFRIMTEAKAQSNLLNPKYYPTIGDNTLNLVLPCDSAAQREQLEANAQIAGIPQEINKFLLQHKLNGEFLVFQTALGS